MGCPKCTDGQGSRGKRALFWIALACVAAITAYAAHAEDPAPTSTYTSPYEMVFTTPRSELTADFALEPRSDFKLSSATKYEDWYSAATKEHLGAWGPRPRTYPAPDKLETRSATWRRERVLAAAERLIGYAYQHHHLPDWEPPADWPWKKTCAGANGKGLDCSNFSTFVYDYALGIRFTSDVDEQALLTRVSGPGGEGTLDIERIEPGDSYRALVAKLASADLVFVKNSSGDVSHVVIWLGRCGVSKDGDPLVIDSTSEGTKDALGAVIPCGIRIRPFRETSWYWRSVSHVLRIVRDPVVAAPAK